MTKQASTSQVPSSRLAWFREIGNAVVDLFFPPSCVSCHRLGAWLCSDCLDEIEVIQPPVCYRCGLPLVEEQITAGGRGADIRQVCPRCRGQTSPLDGRYAFGFHAGPLRLAIHQFKYEGLHVLAGPLGRLMAQGWARLYPAGNGIDVIVPVPLHRSRQRKRGYNQSALLARQLGREIGRPVVEDVLMRIRATPPQVNLNARERQANVHDAFRTLDASLAGKRVLLVDDVCTTGSTLEAAGSALRDAQASSVWAYTLARARNLAQM